MINVLISNGLKLISLTSPSPVKTFALRRVSLAHVIVKRPSKIVFRFNVTSSEFSSMDGNFRVVFDFNQVDYLSYKCVLA